MTVQEAARRPGLHRARRRKPEPGYDDEPDSSLGPLREPGRAGGLFDVFRRRYLLKLLVKKELRVRYQGSIVGLAWSYVQPAVRFCVYFFIIGLILAHNTDHRGIYIFSGMVMLTFFSNALTAGTNSVTKNKSLVRKINIPREMFPVASIAVSLYHMFPMYVIMLIGCLISGWHPDPLAFAAMALAFAILLLYGLGIALILGAVNVYFRDVTNLVQVVTTVLRWVVPMIYPFSLIADKLPGALYHVYLWNPLCAAVLLNHRGFWIPVTSNPAHSLALEIPGFFWERGLILFGVGFVFLAFGQWVFARLESNFADQI